MNRLTKIAEIRNKLKQGQHSIGSWMQIPSAAVGEIMGDAGYDWIAVDLEHGSMGTAQLTDLFRSLEVGNTLPIVRLAQGSLKDAKSALDAGAGGIIIPMVESASQLKEVIDWSCWPPAGKRGVGFSRANLFGKYFEAYREEAQKPLIIAQIEHIRAVDTIDEILAVNGLDAIMIGPYDLTASMGITAEFTHPDFLAARKRILDACKKSGIAAGLHIVQPEPAELSARIEEGYRFIAYSIDSVFFLKSVTNPIKN